MTPEERIAYLERKLDTAHEWVVSYAKKVRRVELMLAEQEMEQAEGNLRMLARGDGGIRGIEGFPIQTVPIVSVRDVRDALEGR